MLNRCYPHGMGSEQTGGCSRHTCCSACCTAAKAGDVVGPIKTDQGYHIIKVHELLLGKLADDEVAATIRQELYADWLDAQAEKAGVEIVFFDAI